MRRWWKAGAWLLIGCALLACVPPVRAEDDAAQAIRAALTGWRDDFNAGRTTGLCDLFAPDLIVAYRGQPDRDYATFCGQLQAALADRAIAFRYALEVEEIIVSGDLAVARVTWTLTSKPEGAEPETQIERGIDIFRRQPDGAWRIARFIAYPYPD